MPLIHTAGLFAAGLLTTTSLFASPATTDDDGLQVPCGAVWSQLPEDLREDLVTAWELPAGERAPALFEIRADARSGEYGARVQRLAERRAERVRAVRQALPRELKVDLREARDLTGDARVQAYRDIRDAALAGDYGERVQDVAETVRERREECKAS